MMEVFEDFIMSDGGEEHRHHVMSRGRVRRDQKTKRRVDLIHKQAEV
jgi:hypothetical protein